MEQIKAAGYIRVSSSAQTEGESLSVQKQSIKKYCKNNGFELTEIYADEGISGGTVKERHGLLECMYDGQDGKFDVLIVHRLSRFGRNARELLENYDHLKNADVELRSISEGIDFASKYGKAMLGMLAVIAELERDIIREQMLENRVAKGRRGIPTSGLLPYGRTYNKETGEWQAIEEDAAKIQWAAQEYLKGESVVTIAKKIGMHPDNLLRILKLRCGDTWTVNFKDEVPIVYNVPRLLPEEIIEQIHERIAFNRRNNRPDRNQRYLLAGFIRCEKCNRALLGLTANKNQYYGHYKHVEECAGFMVSAKKMHRAVFETIFENIVDVPSFENAIAESLPDEKMVTGLKNKIKVHEKNVKKIERDLDKLLDLALTGTLDKQTIRGREQKLIEQKNLLTEALQVAKRELNALPDVNHIKEDAERVRRELLERYGSKERLEEMSFEEKRELLHWVFEGKDKHGTHYGIYVSKEGSHKQQKVDYFLYGKVTGLRTIKGDDINYQSNKEEEDDGKTNYGTSGKGGMLFRL